jgi:lipopolysaccharide export system permease protein
MKLIQRHIGWTITKTFATTLLIVLSINIFIILFNELMQANADYHTWQIIRFVFLKLPSETYAFFPMICLIGSLWGLGQLASQSEIIAIRSAGVSVGQIIWKIILTIGILLVFATWFGEWLAPHATHQAELGKAAALHRSSTLNTNNGLWMLHNKHHFIHIDNIIPKTQLKHIAQYQVDNNNQLKSISYTDYATRQKNDWILQHTTNTQIQPYKIITQSQDKTRWPVHLIPTLINTAPLDTNTMSLQALYNTVQQLHHDGLQTNFYLSALCRRLIQPLDCLIMTFLAIPFILGPLRNADMGFRLFVATLMGLGFYLLNQFFSFFTLAYQTSPFFGALVPPILFSSIGLWFIRQL